MKKSLLIGVLSLFVFPFMSHAALVSCAPGDKFDVNTGKACVVAGDAKDALIASLQQQITVLQAQLAKFGGITDPIAASTTASLNIAKTGDIYISGVTPNTISLNQTGENYVPQYITVYGKNLYKFGENGPFVAVNGANFAIVSYTDDGTSLTFTTPSTMTFDSIADASGNISHSVTFTVSRTVKSGSRTGITASDSFTVPVQ